MKITNVKNGTFFLATAPYNWNSLIIEDVGLYGPLKVIANSSNYFNGYYPEFLRVHGKRSERITKTELKSAFKLALEKDLKYFSANEIEKLGSYFNIKVDKFLSEKQKGWHKDHFNYNKAEKWERKPAQRKKPARNVKKTTTKRK